MTQVLFNQFAYTDRLTRGGFTPEQARASAEALETAFAETVATKTDLDRVETALKADLDRVETALKADLAALSASLDTRFAQMDTSISDAKFDTLKWVIGSNIGLAGLIFAIVKFVH